VSSPDAPTPERPDEHGMTVGRVAAFSDGMFAIAMTVLVLTISVPVGLKTSQQVNTSLRDEIPAVLSFALSFAVIGRYWVAHHAFLRGVRRVNGAFLGLNLLLLGTIALVPFPTSVLGNYGFYVAPTVLYAASIGCVGLTFGILEWYTLRTGLMHDGAAASLRYGIAKSWMAPAVFFTSIPIAVWVSTDWAKYWWLLMVPVGFAIEWVMQRSNPMEATHD
jgi:uncharacterized membrane protein